MTWKNWKVGALTALFALAMLSSVRAREVEATDEGKASEFKGKTVEMKDKDEFAIILAFSAGEEAIVTTKGDKETDVHLFVYDENKKMVDKDTSPGPKCKVKFTPAKDGKYKLLVRNSGGVNKVTLEVKVAK
ncbi:MAG: hypothetical protein ACLP7Q_14170 [Isosphaeraceae bacterium]